MSLFGFCPRRETLSLEVLQMKYSGDLAGKNVFTVVFFVITSFFLVSKIFKLFSWLWQRLCTKKTIPEECLQKDIKEMKKAIEQILVRDRIIQNELGRILETIQGDIQSMKAVIQTLIQNPCADQNGTADDEEAKIDQTDCEMRKKTGVSGSVRKNERSIEYDTSVLIKTVKKSLTDLLKDGKLHLSVDREQENRELEIILEKLSEDRDDIKKHCKVVMLSLENTSDKWIQTVSRIEKVAKQMCDDTKHVKQIFKEIKDLSNTPQKSNNEKKGRNKIMQSDSVGNKVSNLSRIQDHNILSQKRDNRIFIYSCWERMRSASCNVEDGCRSVSNLIYGLEQKLGSLNESIEKLDNFIRGLNLEILAKHAVSANYNETAEIAHGIMQTNQSDAGDGQSQTLHNVTSKMRNQLLAHKIHNTVAIDNAIKLTEIILKKIADKIQGSEKFIPSKPNNAFEESQPIPIADEEHASRSSTERLLSKAEIRN